MANILIRVTAADIQHGSRGQCEKCAVGRAVNRRLKRDFVAGIRSNGRVDVLWVKGEKDQIDAFGRSWKYRDTVTVFESVPDQRVANFIAKFDSYLAHERAQAKPFEFLLEFPDHLGWVFAK